MKYLLLGGAGFIGTHLAKKLLSLGHNVLVIDNLATSKRPDYPVRFEQHNIQTFPQLEYHVADADIVYFLAGSLGVEHIDQNPRATLENNLGLMNTLIPLFQKYQKKVIFSSTSEVYGDGPFSEDNSLSIGPPTKLRWAYAAAKLMTEFAIAANSFPYVIVRFFNVVGPGQLPDYGMVLPKFIRSAKSNSDIVVYGTGEQVRSFCHVSDAVDALLALENCTNEIFNLGNETGITINQLAKRVVELSGSSSKIVHVPYEQAFSKHHADIIKRIPDLTKIKYMISYVPKHDLDDIIKDCL